MRLRLLVAGIVSVLAAFVLLVWGLVDRPLIPPDAGSPPVGSGWEFASRDLGAWDSEGEFLFSSNKERLQNQTERLLYPGDIPQLPSSVRVLVLGDSFVYGAGVSDPDMRWWVKLQDELDKVTSPGVFTVRAMGAGGASSGSLRTWLSEGVLATFDPDIVVVGYVYNDPVPSPEDFEPGGVCWESCPPLLSHTSEFQTCLATRPHDECEAAVGPLFPTAVPESSVLADPLASPYREALELSATDISRLVGDRPLLWLPTPSTLAEWGLIDEVRGLFASAGFSTITPERSLAILRSLPEPSMATPDVHVHPKDRHPGPALTASFALDAVAAVLSAAPPERLDQAMEAARLTPPAPVSLVSWVLPQLAEVGSNPLQARLRVQSSDLARAADSSGIQVVPCAAMGRPHVRAVLSRLLPVGTRVDVSVRTGPQAGLDVFTFGYGDSGEYVAQLLGTASPGDSVSFVSGPLARGVVLAPRGVETCTADQPLSLPDLDVTLTRR